MSKKVILDGVKDSVRGNFRGPVLDVLQSFSSCNSSVSVVTMMVIQFDVAFGIEEFFTA